MNTQLLVKRPTDTTYSNVDLFDDIIYSLTYSVADIRNPESRNGSYSKTVTIPGTSGNNILFEFIFNVNSALQTFNPNLKCDCRLLQDGIEIFKGNLRLANINVTDKTFITYDIELYGQVKGLFDAIANKKLIDLDLSSLNHVRSGTNIINSWTAGQTNGYVYPLIDNGLTNIYSAVPQFWTKNMFPCIYTKTLLDRIFTEAGFTYSSTFLNSSFFKALIIPPDVVNSNLCNVSVSASIIISASSIITGNCSLQLVQYHALLGDTGVIAQANIPAQPYYSNTTFSINTTATIAEYDNLYLQVKMQGTLNYGYGIASASFSVTYPDGSGTFSAGTNTQINYIGVAPATNIVQFQTEIDPNNTFSLITYKHTAPAFNFQNYLPSKVLQRDFIIGLMRMFNLYFEVDTSISNNILIEPRNDYYAAGSTIDWTSKLATDKQMQIIPLGELDARKYLFQFTPTKDFFNHLYTDGDKLAGSEVKGWGEVYGQYQKDITNDFQTKDKLIQPIFSPTLIRALSGTNIVIPTIITNEPSAGTDNHYIDSSVLRILYYGGLKSCNTWLFQDALNIPVAHSTYPYAGHLDDIQSPTVDINYYQPKEVYYLMNNPALYTNNNLFNKYWKDAITEITDKDSKIVIAYFNLTPADIQQLDFRNTIKVDEQYYILNKIVEYSPTIPQLTKVELLKLTKAVPFSPSLGNLNIFHVISDGKVVTNGNNTNTNVHVTLHGKVVTGTATIKRGGKGSNPFETANAQILKG